MAVMVAMQGIRRTEAWSPQIRQFGDEYGRHDGTDTRYAAQQLGLTRPACMALQAVLEFLVQACQFGLHPVPEALLEAGRVQPGEDPARRVVGGDAVRQCQEGAQPLPG